jgi:alginate O-acetyltransferase complex protein AlgI
VFFPQIIAGPIARYKQMEVQIRERKENTKRFAVGVQRFVVGLAKKTLIANALLIVADRVYGFLDTQTITMSLAWLGTIAYTLQIYFDFSGYSDMAIGIGLMFGFKTEENFNFPYIAQSINEFWRRWHISLSTWFKDYVYIPLGGSRVKNQDRIIANLLVVWVLTGLWHGSNWTFVLWGLFNFVVLVFERFVDFENLKLNRVLKHVYALVIINIAWVFFRSNSIYDAGKMLTSMIGVNGFFDSISFMFIREFGIIFLLGFFFSVPIARRMNTMIVDEEKAKWAWIFRFIYPIVMILLFVLSVSTIIKGSYNPFIYFNF